MITPMLRPDLFGGLASHAGDALYELSYIQGFGKVVRALRAYDGSYERFWEDFASRPPMSKETDGELVITYGVSAWPTALAESELQATAQVSISILGSLRIEDGTRRRRRLRASANELIAYLALHPQGATRDELLEALWPSHDPRRSEQRFWQAASDARKLLGDALKRDRDRYLLDRNRIRLDIEELERLLGEAERAADEQTERDLLECALALVRGEPLAGCDYPWADGEVRRLDAVLVDLLERVGQARLTSGDSRGALEAAESGLAIDSLNEAFWRLALRAESSLGLREAVTRRYEQLHRLLDERLGLEPQRDTRALYRALLRQE
jgi:two-component SAPR family response regulator